MSKNKMWLQSIKTAVPPDKRQHGVILVLFVLVVVFVFSIFSLLPFLPGWSGGLRRVGWKMSQKYKDVSSTFNRQSPYVHTNDKALYYVPAPKRKPFLELNVTERITFVKGQCAISTKIGEMHLNEKNNVYVFVDHEHKILACSNLETESSTVASIFYRLLNISSSMTGYKKNDIQKSITAKEFNSYDYVKFMIVRNPIEKLMSEYKDSLALYKTNGTKITFPMFISDVGSYMKYTNNQQFMSTVERCRPCDAGYTYIATIETLQKDMKTILGPMSFIMDSIPIKSLRRVRKYRRILEGELSNRTMKAIKNRYKLDYLIFGMK